MKDGVNPILMDMPTYQVTVFTYLPCILPAATEILDTLKYVSDLLAISNCSGYADAGY